MDKNKQLHELLGLCWHEWKPTKDIPENLAYGSSCKKCGTHINISGDNPDFTSDAGKVQLLREMMKQNDWPDFCKKLWRQHESYCPQLIIAYFAEDFLIDTTGELRNQAIGWLKDREKKEVADEPT